MIAIVLDRLEWQFLLAHLFAVVKAFKIVISQVSALIRCICVAHALRKALHMISCANVLGCPSMCVSCEVR